MVDAQWVQVAIYERMWVVNAFIQGQIINLDGKETKRARFYISGLPSQVERILQVVRKHSSIKNELHWVLDVALSMKITAVSAESRLPKTWRSCAASLSTCSNKKKRRKVASMPSNFKPHARKTTSSKFWPLPFRGDCPEHARAHSYIRWSDHV